MDGKRGIVEFGLRRGFVIKMVEAVGAPRQGRRQPGRPDMAHGGRDVADFSWLMRRRVIPVARAALLKRACLRERESNIS